MRCLTGFAIYMWLLVVSRSSDYWLAYSRVTLIVLVEVEVCLGIPSCGTRWVPRGSRGLIMGSTGRGRPLLYPASVFPTTPYNPASLSYIFSCNFLFLVTLILPWCHISPGYVSIDPQGMYTPRCQHGSIATQDIFLYIPRLCIHRISSIINSSLNLRSMYVQTYMCVNYQ